MVEEAPHEPVSSADESLGVESLWRAIGSVAASPPDDPLLGTTIGGVTIVRQLGEGGMGRVYEGLQESPRRPVAVKVLRPGIFSREVLRRFVNESEILGQLQHPNISQVYSAGSFDIAGTTLPYFVMELIPEARSITQYVADIRPSQQEILTLFRQVCEAVAHGHLQGFVHRDLKPGNILVDCHGHPKVIDFGVARVSNAAQPMTALTDTGQLIGTLQYMSPEQMVAVTGGVDARADVYSLGVILFELLAGRPPYDVTRKTLVEAARIVQEQRPQSLRMVNRAVPWHVEGIVEKCLAKDRTTRFADAGRLAAAIRDGLEGRAKKPSWLHVAIRSARGQAPERAGRIALAVLMVTGAVVAVRLNWPGTVPRLPPLPPALVDQTPIPQPIDPRWNFSAQPVVSETDGVSFRYGFRDINQPGADQFLVEASGMKKWEDIFMFPRISYWAPEANDVIGTLIYRIDFPEKTESLHLRAISDCWDFSREPGGIGRGVSSLEVSPDGQAWTVMIDNITPRRWGEGWRFDEDLGDTFSGRKTLWIRMRFLTEGAPVTNGYNVAQFGRTKPGEADNVFEVRATFQER